MEKLENYGLNVEKFVNSQEKMFHLNYAKPTVASTSKQAETQIFSNKRNLDSYTKLSKKQSK